MTGMARQSSPSSPLAGVVSLLGGDLQAVEEVLNREVCGRLPVIDEMARQSCLAGGKRLRPILLLLTARTVGSVQPVHLTLAAALEMIHAATLVHDDILDAADERRHRPTINASWDNHRAVLFGDFLFTHAFFLASTTGEAAACQTIGQATNLVCEGELQQGRSVWNFDIPVNTYFQIIGKKTAALCGCATRLGAEYAPTGPDEYRTWESMGYNLGLAFQIVDDILDFQGDPADCGKTLGTDLATGKPTLPVLLALEGESAAGKAAWKKKLLDRLTTRDEVNVWLQESQAMERAWAEARSRVDQALAVTGRYDNQHARAFQGLGEFLLHRNH